MNLALAAALLALQQAPAPQRPETTLIRAGRLIDGRSDEAKTDQGILVAGERIGDPLADITELERVKFVMKGGVVYKDETRP